MTLTGPGYADQTQVIPFNIGHGCTGADSVRLEVTIPSDVTTLRALPGVWGEAQVLTNDAGLPTGVVWSKDKARAVDDQFYQFQIRIKVPNKPFTTLYFPAKQTCRAADGSETVVNWSQLPADISSSSGEESHPAPALSILPVRYPGWNKLTVAEDISDLKIFADAQIVWAGDAAYSSNPTTADQIKSEAGVSELTTLSKGSEIWVKY